MVSRLPEHADPGRAYKIHTVLTDNGVHFTTPGNACSAAAEIRLALQRGEIFRAHAFEFACAKAEIDYCLTKPKHLWTHGQVERMNRTSKESNRNTPPLRDQTSRVQQLLL